MILCANLQFHSINTFTFHLDSDKISGQLKYCLVTFFIELFISLSVNWLNEAVSFLFILCTCDRFTVNFFFVDLVFFLCKIMF